MHKDIQKLSLAGLLISLGIIYGDIGTSPLYVFKAIVGGQQISETLILGGISCIFWTLTMQTTIKYVSITLQADNKGEGGKGTVVFEKINTKGAPNAKNVVTREFLKKYLSFAKAQKAPELH